MYKGKIITLEELAELGCEYHGKFSDLLIYSCDKRGFLIQEKGDNKFEIYFQYESPPSKS